MLIPLDHSIWAQLNGPYGVEDAPEVLARLLTKWNRAQADDLFWEKLHHQETIYPVTYAALPWLIEVARRHASAHEEIRLFVSWMLYCAYSRHNGTPQFDGFIPHGASRYRAEEDARLQRDHGPVLADLATWFKDQTPVLSGTCETAADTAAVDGAGYMLCGPAMVKGADWLASSLQGIPASEAVVECLACGEPHYVTVHMQDVKSEKINEQFADLPEPTRGPCTKPEENRQLARHWSKRYAISQPDLSAFLAWYADWRCCG